MTIEELLARESIRHTIASYNIAGDRLRVDDFVAVFTEDAVFESDGARAESAFRCEGRPSIQEWISGWLHGADAPPGVKQTHFVRHHLTTSLIEITGPDTAKARTYWVVYTDTGPDHCGYYLDQFRKTGDRWLIAHRKVRIDWRACDSTFLAAVPR
jgi:hypothetical protein